VGNYTYNSYELFEEDMKTHREALRIQGNAHPAFNMAFQKDSLGNVLMRIGIVLEIGVRYLRGIAEKELTDDVLEDVIAGTEAMYDVHVGPIDLPWVPNIVEPLVDAQLRSLIRPNLKAVADWLRKPLDTTSPEPQA
jgi:hypothetical protein